MFDATHEGIAVRNRKLEIVRHNKVYEERLGPAKTDGAGDRDVRLLCERTARKALEAGVAQLFVERFHDEDGRAAWLQFIFYPIRGGGRVGACGHRVRVRDVTAEREGVEEIARRERMMRTVTDNLPANIAYVDADLRYRFVNRNVCEVLGQAREQILGRPLPDVVGARIFGKIEPHLRLALAGRAVSFREAFDYPARGRRWGDASFVPDFAADGSVAGVHILVLDVTLAQEAVEETARRERMMRMITDNIPANIAYVGPDSRIRFVNRGYEEVYGVRREELIGKHMRDWVGEEVFGRDQERYRQVLAGQSITFEHEGPYGSRGTRRRRVSYVPEVDASGSVAGFFILATDITEMHEVSEELKRTQATLAAAIEQVPAGIVIADGPDALVRLANPAAAALRGVKPEDMIGVPVGERLKASQTLRPDGTPVPPDELPLARALRSGETVRDETLIIRRDDGEQRWVLVNAGPIRDAAGSIVGSVAVFPDITDRMKADADSRFQAEFERHMAAISARLIRSVPEDVGEQLRLAVAEVGGLFRFDRGSIAMWTPDHGGISEFIEWSCPGGRSTAADFRSQAKAFAEVVSAAAADGVVVVPRGPGSEVVSAGPLAPSLGSSPRLVAPVIRSDRVFACICFESDEGAPGWPNRPIGVLRVFADIVGNAIERRDTEIALRTSEARFRAIIEQATDAFFLTAGDGRILEVNRRSCELFGYGREELLRLSMEALAPETARRHPALLEELVARGHLEFETMARNKDGEQIPIEVRVGLTEEAGEERIVALVRDIAQRRRDEEETRRLQAELTHALRLGTMGEMATGFAHELNQPLAAIANYAVGCRRRIEQGETNLAVLVPALVRIAEEAQRAGEIIRRIRGFVSKRPPTVTDVDLAEVAGTSVSLIENEARHARIALVVDLPSQLPRALGDAVSIQQVLINLIRNAVEAVAERDAPDSSARRVLISAVLQGRAIEVTVADTGRGIPPEVRDRLFEPFFTTKATGTGMGLSICRTIIEALGGRITVDSTEGEGTRFSFTLPLAGAEGGIAGQRLSAAPRIRAQPSGVTPSPHIF